MRASALFAVCLEMGLSFWSMVTRVYRFLYEILYFGRAMAILGGPARIDSDTMKSLTILSLIARIPTSLSIHVETRDDVSNL